MNPSTQARGSGSPEFNLYDHHELSSVVYIRGGAASSDRLSSILEMEQPSLVGSLASIGVPIEPSVSDHSEDPRHRAGQPLDPTTE